VYGTVSFRISAVEKEVAMSDNVIVAGTPIRTERHEAICAAVFELLGEVGYDRMSMDAVAARARASKATIYRAWPNKPDLVTEALVHRFGTTPQPPDTGSLRGDLLALLGTACQVINSADGDVIAGLMSAAARPPELARTLFSCLYETKQVIHQTIIERARLRREVPAGTDPKLLHEVLHAMVFSHKLWAAGPMDHKYVVHVIDDVLMPVLCHVKDSPAQDGGADDAPDRDGGHSDADLALAQPAGEH